MRHLTTFFMILGIALPLAAFGPAKLEQEAQAPDWIAEPQDVEHVTRMLVINGAEEARARPVAEAIVEYAEQRELPPVLLVGVIAVENRHLVNSARSTAGARGVMQIMPIWLTWTPQIAEECGRDLTDIRTNVCWGSFILRTHINERGTLRSGLLAYNGCKRTPGCERYPDHVFRYAGQAYVLSAF